MSLNYRLIVLTHGADGKPLEATLASFAAQVTPRPSSASLHADGASAARRAYDLIARCDWGIDWTYDAPEEPIGFCASVQEQWYEAAAGDHTHVFWLEHDFVFNRPVDLNEIAMVLECHPRLAQMSLRRQPVGAKEIAAGGYLNLNPEAYERRFSGDRAWLEHELFWTTTPSLFPSLIPAAYAWPTGPECEGKFGFQLREERPGTRFGIWGRLEDEPWVEHIGERTGKGY